MNNKKRRQKDILYISISSFVLTVLWVGFSIYHNWVTTTINESLQIQIQPIDPNFDMDTVQKLKTRKPVAPVYESKTAPTASTARTTPTVKITQPATAPTNTPQSAQPESNPSPSQPLTPAPTNQVLIQGI